MLSLKRFFAALCGLLVFSLALESARAEYPDKPIRLVVPFAPGGTTDLFGRLVAQALTDNLKVPVIVDNKVGAGGNIGSDYVTKAPADGYTLLLGGAGHLAISPSLYANFPFDPVRDLVPVALVGSAMNVLVVHPSVDAKNPRELAAYVKKHPRSINFASGGAGGVIHLAGEMFNLVAGTDMAHVAYKGSSAAYVDLLSGRVQVMFDNLPSALPYIQSGKLRALGVTSRTRSPSLPDVPTLAEQGFPDYEATTWWALFAPRGTPAPIVERLQREVNAGMRNVAQKIRELGAEPESAGSEQTAQRLLRDLDAWAKVVKRAGLSSSNP